MFAGLSLTQVRYQLAVLRYAPQQHRETLSQFTFSQGFSSFQQLFQVLVRNPS